MRTPRAVPVNILLLILSPLLGTSAEICGHVVDPSGAAVAGATIALYDRDSAAKRTAFSNTEGGYCFHGLPSGRYLAEAEAPGMGSSSATAARLAPDSRLNLDLPLELARVSTRVLVTASAAPQSTDEVSKAMNVVDNDEIDRRAEYSIAGALRLTPGVRVSQIGGPLSLARIQVRGLRSYETAILIDGFRFRDAAAPQGDASGFLSDLQIIDVDRLEVLRGSGASLYGTNAAGGVVQVITDQGGGPLRGTVEAEGGGLGMFRGVTKVAGGGWDNRLQYTAGVAHLNVTGGVDGDDRARNSSGQGFLQFRLNPSSVVSARVFAGNTFQQLNDSPDAAPTSLPPSGAVRAIPLASDPLRRLEAGQPYQLGNATFIPSLNDPDNRRVSDFFSGVLSFSQRVNRSLSYRVGYQGLTMSRDARDGPAGVSFEPLFNSSTRLESRADTLQARADLQAGASQQISAGYEFERERYNNPARDANPDPEQRVNVRSRLLQRSHTGFAQDQLRLLAGRLQISLSGRIQGFHLGRPEFSGGLPQYAGLKLEAPPTAYTGDGSIAWLLSRSNTKLRAHAGNGYRAPSLFERLGTTFFFGSFSPFGDPRLRPERLMAVDAGFDQYFAASRVRLSATYFYTRLEEVIVFDSSGVINPATDPYGRFGGYRNTGGGLARGVELSVEATPTRSLRFSSSYTFTNARERNSTVLDGSLRSFDVSDHMFTFAATQSIRRRFDVTFEMLAASDYTFPFFTGSGSRAFLFAGPLKADVVASYGQPLSEGRTLRFYTRVENVFNRTYFEDGLRTPGAWATAGVKLLF